MKKLAAAVIALALLVPGAAFAGSSTDAALGLGAFAVFNQIISGTGIFGGLHHAPAVVHQPVVQERVVVREYHPVYVQPQPYYVPLYHAPVHYYAPAPTKVIVIKGHPGHGHGHGHGKKGHGYYSRY